MLRKLYLAGDMGEKFGKVVEVAASSVQEVMQYLDANHEGLKKYLLDKTENQIGFKIQIADQYITDENEILLPLDKGDIIITPVPVGSEGIFKVIIGVILIVAAVTMGLTGLALYAMVGAGLMLTMMGIMELMMPDPATDNQEDQKEGYIFQGAEQSIPEGAPVPVLYGELRVPGNAVSFDLRNTTEGLMSSEDGGGSYAISGDEEGNIVRYPASAE
tara:strand:+ start:5245 stop:5895 length:651 start_codon:yes stop_codon:yes gene_type:complete